jgi:DNA polymerase III subunit delta
LAATGKRISSAAAVAAIGKSGPAGIYCVVGSELILVDELIAALNKAVFGDKIDSLNYIRLNGKEAKAGEIIDAVETVPFLGKKRMVLVRDVEKLSATDMERLANHLARASDLCVLLMLIGDGKKATTKPVKELLAQVAKYGQAVSAASPRPRDIFPYIRDRAKIKGAKINSEAVGLLAEFVGTDLTLIDNELEKLALFTGGSEITAESVGEVSLNVRIGAVYELTDAVANKQTERVFALLNQLAGPGAKYLALLAAVVNHLRLLARIRQLDIAHAGPEDYRSILGKRGFKLDDFRRQTRGWSGHRLENAISRLSLLDNQLKSSRLSDRSNFERALLDILA